MQEFLSSVLNLSFTCVDFRAAVADLKNEHELDKQHLQSLHRQEVEALKTAHSHTRWEQTVSSTQSLGILSVVLGILSVVYVNECSVYKLGRNLSP